MTFKPTVEQLAQVAAQLGPTLSPAEGISRARALYEEADKALREDEIADEQASARLEKRSERTEKIGLGLNVEKISMSEAFLVQKEVAESLRGIAFKKEQGFVKAMRDAQLTDTEDVHGKTIEEWINCKEQAGIPIKGTQEYTSRKAIDALFQLRAKGRKEKDHDRHQRGKTAVKRKSLDNPPRAKGAAKRIKKAGKRDAQSKSEPERKNAKLVM